MLTCCKRTASLTLLGAAITFSACIQTREADLIVHNATIFTLDEDFSTAQAMAIRDGRIVEVGTEREILNRYKVDQKYDARKMYVYPGFIDAHSHFMGYARNKSEVSLYGATSMDEVLRRVAAFAKNSDRTWIVGRGWDQNLWPGKEFPDKYALDSLFPDRPVLLTRIDGHAALANELALRKAGVKVGTVVAGGKIMRHADGSLTGLLIDRAIDRVSRFIPPISADELVKRLLEAQSDCLAAGLTTVSDLGLTVQQVHFIDSLQQAGILSIRVYASLKPDDNSLELMRKGPMLTERLSVRSVKAYADGALGSRGALLKAPYTDDPDNSGLLLTPQEELDKWARACLDYGFQLNVHCIGDSANAFVLGRFAHHLNEMNDLRWRIEHAQVVSPTDMHYFRSYGIIPSVQPMHATSDGSWAGERLGPERIAHAYAYESLRQTLGILALGTDFPVEYISPLYTFSAAVFRMNPTTPDHPPFQPEEALSSQHALRGMTIWAAIASFEETHKGSLEAGKFADFVVVNRDLSKVSVSDMPKVKVMTTFLDGVEQGQ